MLRGTFGTGVALVFGQATSAIALLVLARRSGTESFGMFIGLYAASLSVGALLDFGSSQCRTRELARGRELAQFRWWLRRRSILQIPAVVVGGGLAVVLISDRLPLICTAGVVTQALTYNVSHGAMASVRSLRSPVLAEWFVGAGNLVLLVACVASPSSSLLEVAGLAAAGSWALTAVCGLVVTRRLVGGQAPSPDVSRNPWSGSTSFGASSLSHSIQGFLIGSIGWTSGADEAALVGGVNKWGQPIGLFAAAYATYMFPAFASASTDRQALLMLRPLRLIAAGGTLVAITLISLSSWLVDNLLGQRYAGADTILRLLLLAAIPVLLAQPLAAFLQARGAERFVARTSVIIQVSVFAVTIASSFALGAVSIPVFSLVGSAVLLLVLGRRVLTMTHRQREA